HLVQLHGTPKFDYSKPTVFPGSMESVAQEIVPERFSGLSSRILAFQVSSPSPTSYEITGMHIDVREATPTQDWAFPYYGEASGGVSGTVVKGYAELQPKQKRSDVYGLDIAAVGKDRATEAYQVRLFADSAHRYRIGITIHWQSLDRPTRTGDSICN